MKYTFVLLFLVFALSCLSQHGNDYSSQQLLLRDEGLSQVSYINFKSPAANWLLPVPKGRDLQLIGSNLFLIGTESGFEEHDLYTGKKVFELTSFPGTIAARRLRNGNTLLTGLNWQEKMGIVLLEVNNKGTVQRLINYPKYNYVRLVRETSANTYLITSDTIVFEGDKGGAIIWEAKIKSEKEPHAWQPLRLSNGNTVVSTGFGGSIQIFSADGNLIKVITGPDDVKPNFYAGFQVLKSGNFLVTNWQGHGPGHGDSGTQLLEYTPDGKLVWSWKQDASKYSSLQGVIALNGLNPKFLHVEGADGELVPVKTK